MFDRPGETIKSFAIIIFVCTIIVSLIIAISNGKFLLTLLIGFGAGFAEAIILYAFGQLVTSTEEISYRVSECVKLLEEMKKQAPSNTTNTDTMTSKPDVTTQKTYSSPITLQKPKADDAIRCPNCGRMNRIGADSCEACGKAFPEW